MKMPRPGRFRRQLKRFLRDEQGPTAAEYAVMLALIILVSVVAIDAVGQKFFNLYTMINSAIPEGAGSTS